MNLAGANLEEWRVRGRGPTQPLNLRNANLSQVRLNRARLEDVDLAGANLSGLAARQALCLKVSAPQACARNADVRGLKWREGRLEGADFTGAQVAGSQWLHVGLEGATLPEGWERLATVVKEPLGGLPSQKGALVPAVFLGHASRVEACAWSPDGQRLLSGALDATLKVWDAGTGACLLTLSGHAHYWANLVRACAWSPEGQRLLSCADDNTLKVWDAGTGVCLLTLSGHDYGVKACAWSPDGQRLLSGGKDGTLKVWDASTGQCVWSGQLLPEGQTAVIDEAHGRILHASPEAWRWLGWRWTDSATGRLRILPAESFGPLPA